MKTPFERFSEQASKAIGHTFYFITMTVITLIWVVLPFLIDLNQGWTQFADALTLILLFIMQRSQNRDKLALDAKLDKIAEHLGVRETIEMDDKNEKELEKELNESQNKKRYNAFNS